MAGAGALLVAVSSHAEEATGPASGAPSAPAPDERRPSDGPAADVGSPKVAPSVQPPKPIQTSVDYPDGASGVAEVVLDVVVGASGQVTEVAVVAGMAPFGPAASAAARSWTFQPALRNGKPVAARIRYTLRFEPPAEVPSVPVEAASGSASPEVKAPAGGSARASDSSSSEAGQAVEQPPAEVVVRGERPPAASVRIVRSESRNLAGTFGDPLRAIEAQPGVVPVVSGLPVFFIRGAPPANVGFFIDGVDVPLLYHAFFGPSVLHPTMIESVDLYRGSAPVDYGRFAGPVVAANLSPPPRRWGGEANLRTIDAGAIVQAPFGNCETGQESCRGSARIAGRYSYTGLILQLLSNAQLKYWDYQGQAQYSLGPNDTLSVLAFGAYDFFQADRYSTEQRGGEVEFHRIDLRYDHQMSSGANLRVALTAGSDRTGATDDSGSTVRDKSLRGRATIDAVLGSNATLHTGVDVRFDDFGLDTNPVYLSFSDYTNLFPPRKQTVLGAYMGADWKPAPGVTVLPGVRADWHSMEGQSSVGVDPRLALNVAVHPKVTVEGSFGLAHQLPNFAPQVPGAQVANIDLQEAWLWSSGVRWKAPGDLTVTGTLFENAFFNALDPIGGSRDFSIDKGVLNRRAKIVAQGFELGISRPLTRRLGGLLSYTFTHSQETMEGKSFVSGFDRPNVIHAALSYDLGRGIRIGARATAYSGIPAFMPGPYAHFSADRRGDPFFRLDGRIEKRWTFSNRWWLSVAGEILNATSSKEVVRLDCGESCLVRTAGPVILPNIGVEAGM